MGINDLRLSKLKLRISTDPKEIKIKYKKD